MWGTSNKLEVLVQTCRQHAMFVLPTNILHIVHFLLYIPAALPRQRPFAVATMGGAVYSRTVADCFETVSLT